MLFSEGCVIVGMVNILEIVCHLHQCRQANICRLVLRTMPYGHIRYNTCITDAIPPVIVRCQIIKQCSWNSQRTTISTHNVIDPSFPPFIIRWSLPWRWHCHIFVAAVLSLSNPYQVPCHDWSPWSLCLPELRLTRQSSGMVHIVALAPSVCNFGVLVISAILSDHAHHSFPATWLWQRNAWLMDAWRAPTLAWKTSWRIHRHIARLLGAQLPHWWTTGWKLIRLRSTVGFTTVRFLHSHNLQELSDQHVVCGSILPMSRSLPSSFELFKINKMCLCRTCMIMPTSPKFGLGSIVGFTTKQEYALCILITSRSWVKQHMVWICPSNVMLAPLEPRTVQGVDEKHVITQIACKIILTSPK